MASSAVSWTFQEFWPLLSLWKSALKVFLPGLLRQPRQKQAGEDEEHHLEVVVMASCCCLWSSVSKHPVCAPRAAGALTWRQLLSAWPWTEAWGPGVSQSICPWGTLGLLVTGYWWRRWWQLLLASECFVGYDRSASFFHKGSHSKYFKVCRPYGLCCNFSTLLLLSKSSHRQRVNEWAWLFQRNCIYKVRRDLWTLV